MEAVRSINGLTKAVVGLIRRNRIIRAQEAVVFVKAGVQRLKLLKYDVCFVDV